MTSRTPAARRADGTRAAPGDAPRRRRGAARHCDGLLAVVALGTLLTGVTGPAARGDERAAFFESRIRPLFERACVECHSGDDAAGGVRLTDRAGWADAGVVEPGRPEASRLLEVLRSADPAERMPPPDSGATVTAAEIRDVAAWITAGALDPREAEGIGTHLGPRLRSRVFAITPEDGSWWAFQPIIAPAFTPAEAAFAPSARIDLLVRRGLATAPETAAALPDAPSHPGGLPSPPATPRELVRRASFDLWGLPPAPETVAAFAADPSEAAWQRLVDDLLASHHYGERQAQHWLDWVRYAETNGYERDGDKPDAWRYRDYVIRSFASDRPYDRFVIEQLAGDEWAATRGWSPEHEPEQWRDAVIATGFLRLHQWDDEPDSSDQAELDDADDVLVTIASAFLGLTVGCARCHDHKYDPVSQRDYYALLSFLRGIDPYGRPKRGGGGRGTGQIQRALATVPAAAGQGTAAGSAAALPAAGTTAAAGGDPPPVNEKALAVVELPQPKATFVLHRGDRTAPREEVGPAVPGILRDRSAPLPPIEPCEGSSGRRLALARWLVDPAHPLTARVLANRIWQGHFGTGLVPTPDDFGRTGAPPSNPALLDFLARELVESGWSVRHLHRIILGSHAYRMTSRSGQPALAAADPDARLVWRQSIRRLDAEAIRDALLAVAGHLGPKAAGPSVYPTLPAEVTSAANSASFRWPESPAADQDCRSVYLVVKRALPVPFLDTLDRVTVSAPTVVRPVTTTAPQALMLLNDPWVHRQAARLRDRLAREAGPEPSARIVRLWQLVHQREPTAAETAMATSFLREQAAAAGGEQAAAAGREQAAAAGVESTPPDAEAAAWQSLCRAVMTSNEALYVE